MPITISVTPRDTREARIATEVENPARTQRFHELRDTPLDLPVIRVPTELPVYRLSNFRTYIQQQSQVRAYSLGERFFALGQENESAQQRQHQILWQLAQQRKQSIASIIEVLEQQGQREPLLITRSGVVVNGNRRLAAMRELLAQDGLRHHSFSHVDCLVLPLGVNESEVEEIEVRLQMTPETRLPYEWVNECIAVRELQTHGRQVDQIARLMRMQPAKVREKMQMLAEVDMYLCDWLQSPGDYERVEDSEEMVSQVSRRLVKKEGTQQEIARRIAWVLLSSKTDGRAYDYREVVGTLTEPLVRRIQELHPEASVVPASDEADIEFAAEDEGDAGADRAMIAFLEGARGNEPLLAEILALSNSVIEATKQVRRGNAALMAATEARTKLGEIELGTAEAATYQPILLQIEAIEAKIAELREQLALLIAAHNDGRDSS